MTPEAMLFPAATSTPSSTLPTYILQKMAGTNASFYINDDLEEKLLSMVLDSEAFVTLRTILLSLPSTESDSILLFKEAPGFIYSGLTLARTEEELRQMANDIENFLIRKSTHALKRERHIPADAPILTKRARSMGAEDADTAAPSLATTDLKTMAKSADGDVRATKMATAPVTTREHIAYLREVVSNYRFLAPGILATGPLVEMLRRADTTWDKMAMNDSLTPKQKIIRATRSHRLYQDLANHEQTSRELRIAFLEEVQEVEDELKRLRKEVPPQSKSKEIAVGKVRAAGPSSAFFKESRGELSISALDTKRTFVRESKFCVLAKMERREDFDNLCKAMLVFEGGLLGKLAENKRTVDFTSGECVLLKNILSYHRLALRFAAPPQVCADFSVEDFATLVSVVNRFGAQIIEEFQRVNRLNYQSFVFSKEAVEQLQVILSPYPILQATLSWPAPGGSPGLFAKPSSYEALEAVAGDGAFVCRGSTF